MDADSAAPPFGCLDWKLHHVALSVPDLDQAIEWYGEFLGFSVVYQTHVPNLEYQVAFVERAGLRIEMLQVPNVSSVPPERGVPTLDLVTAGWKHLCLEVDDVDKALAHLKGRGVDIAMEAFEHDGIRAAFIRDNSGSLIEIVEMAGDAAMRDARDGGEGRSLLKTAQISADAGQ